MSNSKQKSQELSRKIVTKLINDKFKVQSNQEGDDEHIFVFDREDHSGKHVHLVVDGETGEVRIDPKDKPPHDLLEKVVTITTKSGVKIRSTRTTLEFLEEESEKPNIIFEINENKSFSWQRWTTGFNMIWGFGFTLKINNFKNDRPDYVSLKLRGNTNDGPWESQHFIFQETKDTKDRSDEPFEVAPNKILEIGVVLSQDYPEHSPLNNQRIIKPNLDTNTVVLVVSTESGVEQEIQIKPRLVSGA